MATHKPVYVDELFGTLEVSTSEAYKWYVIRTKYQSEKALAKWAKDNNIEYYLPQYKSTKKYQYRKIETTKPLFSGYIFVKMNYDQKITLLRPGYIIRVITVKHQDILVEELSRFYFIQEKGYSLLPANIIEKGTKVKVVSGPLAGTIGFVLEGENPNKIIITANIINQAVEVTLKNEEIKIIQE
jgi:transcription antitermination factor NusG